MGKIYYQRLDKEGAVGKGLANLYLKGNKIYIRLPDKLGLGRNKYVSTGLNNVHAGRVQARNILTVINNDILLETFDLTLERYLPKYKSQEYKTEVEKLIGCDTPLYELWTIHCNFKKDKVKESTHYYLSRTIGDKIKECPITDIYKADTIKDYLLATTTEDYAYRVLGKLSSLFDWCVAKGIIATNSGNPYKPLLERTSKNNVKPPNPLTPEQVSLLEGQLPEHYQRLTKFLFATGCRPSEAIGLKWTAVKDKVIVLGSSTVKKGGHTFESDSSKNGKLREFPLTDKVRTILGRPIVSDGYCFTNSNGGIVDYNNYYKAWRSVLPDTTPYNARDTFITRQIELGKPIATIAAWVDNSVKVIEDNYYRPSGRVLPE